METEEIKYIGMLCKHGHKHKGLAFSIRYKKTRACVECSRLSGIAFKQKFPRKLLEKNKKYIKKEEKNNFDATRQISVCKKCDSSRIQYLQRVQKYRCRVCGHVGIANMRYRHESAPEIVNQVYT